jgi:hypothetical protein
MGSNNAASNVGCESIRRKAEAQIHSNTYTSLSQQKYYDATSLRRQAAIFNRHSNFNKCTLAGYNSTATRLAIAFSLSGKYTERVCG